MMTLKIWLNVIACVILFFTSYAMYQYITHRKEENLQLIKAFRIEKDLKVLILLVSTLLIAIYIFEQGFLSETETFMRAFMNAEVFIWLATLAYIDLKEKIIPNSMILCGLIFWFALVLMDILVGETPMLRVLIFSLTGGFLCGGILFIIALIVKSALGMGDVKLFMVLGLLYGLIDTYSILLFTIFIMAIVSIALLVFKKVTLKTAIPMAPFVVLGFFISILAGM